MPADPVGSGNGTPSQRPLPLSTKRSHHRSMKRACTATAAATVLLGCEEPGPQDLYLQKPQWSSPEHRRC
ncbi:hypothetical protein NN561_017126 [Cricetulus griseus]